MLRDQDIEGSSGVSMRKIVKVTAGQLRLKEGPTRSVGRQKWAHRWIHQRDEGGTEGKAQPAT